MARWQTKSSSIVHKTPWIIVHNDEVIQPDGTDSQYTYIEGTSNSVFVVPVDDEGNTYIVQQERYTSKSFVWECVAGRTDDEPIEVAAKRELLEETGLSARSITNLLTFNTACSVSALKTTLCLAQDLEKVTDRLDEVDGITACKKLPLSEVKRMIMDKEITCSESIAAFLFTINYLEEIK
jgi:8-oxo-dGTP pyrophosphatase MutT (NUDIX family)